MATKDKQSVYPAIETNEDEDEYRYEHGHEEENKIQEENSRSDHEEFQFLLVSHKDSDILTLSTAQLMLPLNFPSIETLNLCTIKTETDMAELVTSHYYERQPRVVILVRLLGRGVPGFHHLLEYSKKHNHDIVVVSGIPGSFEPDLTAMCTVSTEIINQVISYFNADGCSRNLAHMFRYLADHLLGHNFGYEAPTIQPDHGLYHPRYPGTENCDRVTTTTSYLHECFASGKPTVAIIFYRCHFLSGNTSFVDAIIDELEALDVNGIGLFTETLRDHKHHQDIKGKAVEKFPTALTYLLDETTGASVDVLISTMAFAMGEVNPDGPTLGNWATEGLQAFGVPVLQAVNSFGAKSDWEESPRGLGPLDTAMNVAIPEFDGRIITVPVSFKAPQDETNKVHYYEPVPDRVKIVAKQAAKLSKLSYKPNKDKRVVFMLTNSSGKAQRIGDAVGLDSPASVMRVLEAMQADGYDLGDNLPLDGDQLVQDLVDRCSYDEIFLTEKQLANAAGHVPATMYNSMFDDLPKIQQDHMLEQWGTTPGKAYVHENSIALAGLEYGNVFVALQPPRGYGMDAEKIYHTPDLAPPHNYFAIYKWLRDVWKADAMVHMGKHGTLEWLPGKGVGLSGECYPDTFLDDMPLVYPFIINDPGEGTQSKRRAHAIIIDHLTPPMTTADGYGELAQLMQLVDEYYQIETLDPTKLPSIQKQIWELIQQVNLDKDLSVLLRPQRSKNEEEENGYGHNEIKNEDENMTEYRSHGQDHHEHEEENMDHHGHFAHSHKNYAEKKAIDHDHDYKHDHNHDHNHSNSNTQNKKKEHEHNHDNVNQYRNVYGKDNHEQQHEHNHEHDVNDGNINDQDSRSINSHVDLRKERYEEKEAAEAQHDHDHDHCHEHFHEMTKESLAKMDGKDFAHLIEDMDGYLCELAGAQIRDGLHILGQVPSQGDSMVDMLQALTRLPNLDVPSLREAIASVFELDSRKLLSNQGTRIKDLPPELIHLADRPLATAGDAVQTIDELAKHLLALLDHQNFDVDSIPSSIEQTFPGLSINKTEMIKVLDFVCKTLVPSLRGTTQEISYLLDALNGKFVPAGPSGSPTRGMAHLLPTGRNFYACDPQALPSLAAWEVGQGLAKEVSNRYLTETGAYPEHVAISVWGTSAMRTHGDDIAQIFALLGVQPIWQKENHRVIGVELIPLSELCRPRIDVTIRISGFFRDAFPHLITLLDEAVNLAINADEPLEQNFIRKHFLEDMEKEEMKEESARYRIFGCPPGAYGIGLLELIEAQNWEDESDLAKCYINWGGYAYSSKEIEGTEAKSEFTHRLTTVEVAIHNQDDREHDIFDSDDYFQFHGGMIATIKALSGIEPKGYFGDTQDPANPKVRDIKEEALRVYRTRVVNPKWLESISHHGYKGASEMAATVDYLFGFDATANVVDDFMYEQIAQSYALDKSTQDFYEESNPWALRGISERLLEATQRGMWDNPNPETLDALRQTLLKFDDILEGRSEQPPS